METALLILANVLCGLISLALAPIGLIVWGLRIEVRGINKRLDSNGGVPGRCAVNEERIERLGRDLAAGRERER